MRMISLLFLLAISGLARGDDKKKEEDILCSRRSDGVNCRSQTFYTRCGDKANQICLPTEDEPKLEKDNTVLCSCKTKPTDEKVWGKVKKSLDLILLKKITIPN